LRKECTNLPDELELVQVVEGFLVVLIQEHVVVAE
jgi:hypothetical protein